MHLKLKHSWIFILSSIVHFFLCNVIHSSKGAYVEQFLESVEVCTSAAVGPFSNLAKKKIRLANFPNETVIFKLTRWEQFWPSFLNFRCKFQIIAPRKSGVMVVIQSMHLRTNLTTSSCRDFVKFEQGDGFQTGEICGDIKETDVDHSPKGLIGRRYFHDNGGRLDVSFSTDDKDPPGLLVGGEETKPVFLKMIFTAYSECSHIDEKSGKLKRCSQIQSQSCIHAGLICDGEINCGIEDKSFGADEQQCDEHQRNLHLGSETTPWIYIFTITNIATLLLVFITMSLAFICIRRFIFVRRIAQHDHILPLQEHSINTNRNIGVHLQTQIQGSPTVVTDESTEKKPKKPSVRHDQPPPYDTLFPSSSSNEKQ